jgi:asparagine synthase (glutamine-hydrolysing)
MAQALGASSHLRVELHQAADFGLGRVSLAIANPEPQPVWSADHTICLVLEGELYNRRELWQMLADAGLPHPAEGSDSELVLQLYQAYGTDFAIKVNGAFAVAIWNQESRQMVLVNDRLGLYPLYYAHVPSGLIFACGVRALLAEPMLPRCVDKIAMAQFLTFDHVLGQRTLLEGVHLLPQATVLAFQEGRLTLQNYWRPQHPLTYEFGTEDHWREALAAGLRKAVERQAPGNLPAGLLLSGGLDSRYLAALLVEQSGPPLRTFTWGIPGCDDVRYAAELAKILKTQHYFYELKPDWLKHRAAQAVALTDGLGNVVNLHALATLDQEAQHARIAYKGFLGDAMMGYALRPQFWADYDNSTRYRAHFQAHEDQGVITFHPKDHANLFTDAFQRAVGDGVMDAYRRGMDSAGSIQLADQRIYFDYTQRVPRMTLNGVEVVRSQLLVRLPFADNDLVELALRIPPGWRYERRLVRSAFITAYPILAQVPSTDNGLPMVSCARDLRLRGEDWLRWHLQAAGLKMIRYPRGKHYQDYEMWFRGILRSWVEETVLSEQALARGYFNPQAVRHIVAEHMAGTDHTVRIGALLTLELWHRQFME